MLDQSNLSQNLQTIVILSTRVKIVSLTQLVAGIVCAIFIFIVKDYQYYAALFGISYIVCAIDGYIGSAFHNNKAVLIYWLSNIGILIASFASLIVQSVRILFFEEKKIRDNFLIFLILMLLFGIALQGFRSSRLLRLALLNVEEHETNLISMTPESQNTPLIQPDIFLPSSESESDILPSLG